MAYTALYRKFRPDTFEDVKGQNPIVRALSNQIKHGRVGHAYLFCGTRGTGKTSVAKIMARAINCENPQDGSPCNECAVCRGIIQGTSMNVVEIDAASNNGVDSIRQIVEEVKYSPTEGSYRVYIIDEVHMLSSGAFNALLKTLEEPPSYVVFILATTEAHKIPITILSRCQRYDFKRISLDTITARLRELCDKEGIKAEEGALRYIAKCGEGSMRDSLSLLERCIAFYFEEELTYDRVLEILGGSEVEEFSHLLRYIDGGLVDDCMETVERQISEGRDLTRFIVDFTWYMRNLLIARTGRDINELLEVSSEQMEIIKNESQVFEPDRLMRYISLCCELTNKLRYATQKRVMIETELIKLCCPEMEDNAAAFRDRVRRLEEELEELKKRGFVPAEENSEAPAKEPEKAADYAYCPEALPEEIEDIAQHWKEIRNGLSGTLSTILISATPSVTQDGKLLIVPKDELDYKLSFGDLATKGDTSVGEKHIHEIEEEIQKVTGRHVTVVAQPPKTKDGKVTEKHFDITKEKSFMGIPIEVSDE